MKALCLAVATALTLLAAGCSSSSSGAKSSSGSTGAKFVAKEKQDSTALASDVTAIITEAAAADPTDDSGMTQLASDAQELHGHLNTFKSTLLLDIDADDADQSLMYQGEGDIKNAVGAIDTWTGNANPSTAASWQRQMGTGVGEWNKAVTAIWAKAGAGAAPTVTIPSG